MIRSTYVIEDRLLFILIALLEQDMTIFAVRWFYSKPIDEKQSYFEKLQKRKEKKRQPIGCSR